ncbi:archaeosortase A [Halodesulfurarchaeum sp.]|uniref:archaeosortase A n=1 Tax=Halodesulfurarchaeum sp. TaxID=1980530 RepID=UPI002FC288E9
MVAIADLAVVTDPLAWVVILIFASSGVLSWLESPYERHAATVAWSVFAVFWVLMIPHYAIVQRSIIEGLLSAIAVPGSLYVGWIIWSGQRSFTVITKAVAIMGFIYLPFEAITFFRSGSIELVARNVEAILGFVGVDPTVVTGQDGLRSTFVFVAEDGHHLTTRVVLACTGIGSISIVSGLALAVDASPRRQALGIAIAIPIIYGLNVLRVAFIALAHGFQWFAGFREPIFLVFGIDDPYLVSYIVADRVISQSLSVVALILITLALLRLLPELSTVVEDVLFLLTGQEYDLERAD